MYCPQCGSTHADDLNFCKTCGANLQAVRGALVKGTSPDEKLDWNRTWLAEMVMTGAEKDRRRGITPELKRRREIKAGVITASAGAALTVVLAVLMEGIVGSGLVSTGAAIILSRIWIAGLIPLLIGFGLIVNGLFVSKKGEMVSKSLDDPLAPELPAGDASDFAQRTPLSVTDSTTRHLEKVRPSTKDL
jgi:hypothetical protein